MQNIKRVLFILLLTIASGVYCNAQEVYIGVRPRRPHYERVISPSPRHVWIDEEWEPRGGSYVFVGGRWAEPPGAGMIWVPGHWKHHARGWIWIRGHWR